MSARTPIVSWMTPAASAFHGGLEPGLVRPMGGWVSGWVMSAAATGSQAVRSAHASARSVTAHAHVGAGQHRPHLRPGIEQPDAQRVEFVKFADGELVLLLEVGQPPDDGDELTVRTHGSPSGATRGRRV